MHTLIKKKNKTVLKLISLHFVYFQHAQVGLCAKGDSGPNLHVPTGAMSLELGLRMWGQKQLCSSRTERSTHPPSVMM